jgi:hypothetical protein
MLLVDQTQESTDVRWVKLMADIYIGKKMKFSSIGELEELNEYPYKYDQTKIRPSIRAIEKLNAPEGESKDWSDKFWNCCMIETFCYSENTLSMVQQKQIKHLGEIKCDKKYYSESVNNVRNGSIEHYFDSMKTTAVDAKLETVFGITLYALDNFIESLLTRTACMVNGRLTLRLILESYITLAYLTHKEENGENLYDAYREYGHGQVTLIAGKYRDNGWSSDIIEQDRMEIIAGEDKSMEFTPINLGNWDNSNLRHMSEEIGERDL